MDRVLGLDPGLKVDIQRTDGRVHTAVISGVNHETNSVTVEWFERGETKGKEIELDTLFKLNPELQSRVTEAQNILPSKLKRIKRCKCLWCDKSSKLSVNLRATIGTPSTASRRQNPGQYTGPVQRRSTVGAARPDANTSAVVSTTPQRRASAVIDKTKKPLSMIPSYVAKQPVLTSRVAPADETKSQTTRATRTTRQNGRAETASIPAPMVTQPPPAPVHIPEPMPSSRQTYAPPVSGQAAATAAAAAAAASAALNSGVTNGKGQAAKRSNVVKEVERLKKNREERRLKQAEIKENQEALKNLDRGNPNWEFMGMIRDYQSGIDFRPLQPTDSVETNQITVCVRKRPLSKKETQRKEVDVITVPNRDQLAVHEPKQKVDLTKYLENHLFRFDYAFDETASNEMVYRFTAQPLVQTIFEGGMATCFAYGQTGSGKTHTMGGDFHGRTQDCKKGIYAMAATDVFKLLHSQKYRHLNLRVSSSFFEIYSGKVFDLLANKAKLRVLEDGKQEMNVVGLTEREVQNVDDVLKYIQIGNTARTSGQTSANSNSSRSHAVFQILLRPAGQPNRLHGKFSLIDLAGNERGADTSSANRQTRMEGAEINKSLLALKECIRALGKKGAHLPFRASKLTLVLRDSFIGEKSQTCMIAMISPGLSSCEHSLNTLRYADRVKELAAADPTQEKGSPSAPGGGMWEEEDDDLKDDLRQLRSLNEHELSADLITFHQAVSQLQLMEEELLETHKQVVDQARHWLEIDDNLVQHTNAVDYDQEEFSQVLQDLLEKKLAAVPQLMELKDKVVAFRRQMAAEEQLSQRMINANWNNHN